MKGLFITGTDTGCGKTCVGAALARGARERGLRVRILKPVETGCSGDPGELRPEDALTLARAAGDERSLDRICPYRLRLPAAPELAARSSGIRIELPRIRAAYRDSANGADLVLVEGAGGLLVPLAPGLDMADLARELGTPLVIVARARLGTLNHTRLTLEAARTRDLPVAGVVISHTSPELSGAERANLDLLLEGLAAPLLGELAFGAKELPATLLDALVHS